MIAWNGLIGCNVSVSNINKMQIERYTDIDNHSERLVDIGEKTVC